MLVCLGRSPSSSALLCRSPDSSDGECLRVLPYLWSDMQMDTRLYCLDRPKDLCAGLRAEAHMDVCMVTALWDNARSTRIFGLVGLPSGSGIEIPSVWTVMSSIEAASVSKTISASEKGQQSTKVITVYRQRPCVYISVHRPVHISAGMTVHMPIFMPVHMHTGHAYRYLHASRDIGIW